MSVKKAASIVCGSPSTTTFVSTTTSLYRLTASLRAACVSSIVLRSSGAQAQPFGSSKVPVVEVLLEAGANPMRTMRTDNEANKGKHAIDIAELYNRKGEGSIKDLLYDYKEKRRLERIAKGDYQRKGIPPDRKGKYEL